MKAFLLAAGLGTRLRPLTDQTPKCLLPVGGQPLLEIWLELLGQHGVDEVLVNTHHLAGQVRAFSRSWDKSPRIRLAHEETLLGSAGTILANWNFVANEESFLVCYADNLTDINLSKMLTAHAAHDGLITMALFRSSNPRACGIAELGPNERVVTFEEKPTEPRSDMANAGVYVMRRQVRAMMPETQPADIGFDLLPRCVGRMYGWLWPGLLLDVGTPTAYEQAQKVVVGLSRTDTILRDGEQAGHHAC